MRDYPGAVEKVHCLDETVQRRSGSKIGLRAVHHAFLLDFRLHPYEDTLVRITGLEAVEALETVGKDAAAYWSKYRNNNLYFHYEEGNLEEMT